MKDPEQYLVRQPEYLPAPAIKNRQSPAMTLMSPAQVPEADCRLEIGWIYGVPEPNPADREHVHDHDQIIMHIGGNPRASRDLGAVIEMNLAGEPLVFGTTTLAFIPRGVRHGPVTWRSVTRPHVQLVLSLGARDTSRPAGPDGEDRTAEEYLVRTPVREVGREVKNRQMPTLTYLSRHLVPGANYYLECGWIYGLPEPNPHVFEHEHAHDELVIHFGSDPDTPEDLGGEIEYTVEGQPLTISTSSGLYLPAGVKHGPLTWRSFSRPHLEMTLVMGAGTFREVWSAASFGGRHGTGHVKTE